MEYGEYAKNLFHDGSLSSMPCSLGCWQQQVSLMCPPSPHRSSYWVRSAYPTIVSASPGSLKSLQSYFFIEHIVAVLFTFLELARALQLYRQCIYHRLQSVASVNSTTRQSGRESCLGTRPNASGGGGGVESLTERCCHLLEK